MDKPTLWVRAGYWVALLCVLFSALFVCGMLFGSQAQRLVCDRHNGSCEVNGVRLVYVDEIKGAELRTYWMRSSGHFKMVTLVLRDGRRVDASTQGAQSDRSVAEYAAAVDAIRKFLADPTAPRLDVTYTYRASLGEKIFSVIGFVVLLFVALLLRAKRQPPASRSA